MKTVAPKLPKILFENDNLWVYDKPAGLSVHGDGKTKEVTLADLLLKKYKFLKGVGESQYADVEGKEIEIKKPGIVHRLDKDTSGCIVVAKNNDAYSNLKNQFKNKKVRKEYLALVYGDIKYDTGVIDSKIARSKTDFRKKEIVRAGHNDFRGEEREALTRYKVLKRFSILNTKVTLVSFYPETGRMHQLRIHAKSIGHPIVGDTLYGIKKHNIEKKIFGKTKIRQMLHARAITFVNPHEGSTIKVESPIPKIFDYKM